MYIKETYFGFAVYLRNHKLIEVASYDEALNFIAEKENKSYEH